MDALLNAHTEREADLPPHIGHDSNVTSKEQGSLQGVSSDYAQKKDHHWFVLRVTYNRVVTAYERAVTEGITAYLPMHDTYKLDVGKRRRTREPLIPNIVFIYATRQRADSFVSRPTDSSTFYIRYYLDRTQRPGPDQKHPPLTIPYAAMINFIMATSTDSEHTRLVGPEQCHYRSGDMVRVIDGSFKGIVGRVARISGQQRVVVEVAGLCLFATAYIPSCFIQKMT